MKPDRRPSARTRSSTASDTRREQSEGRDRCELIHLRSRRLGRSPSRRLTSSGISSGDFICGFDMVAGRVGGSDSRSWVEMGGGGVARKGSTARARPNLWGRPSRSHPWTSTPCRFVFHMPARLSRLDPPELSRAKIGTERGRPRMISLSFCPVGRTSDSDLVATCLPLSLVGDRIVPVSS